MKKVLFLCVGNSCRSQIAEAWCNHLSDGSVWSWSAGSVPAGLHPMTIQVMEEVSISLDKHRSKSILDLEIQEFDLVITLCDAAQESCPAYIQQGVQLMHQDFPDPQSLEEFRQVRDDIRQYVADLLASLA